MGRDRKILTTSTLLNSKYGLKLGFSIDRMKNYKMNIKEIISLKQDS